MAALTHETERTEGMTSTQRPARSRGRLLAAVVTPAVALAVASCGGGGSDFGDSPGANTRAGDVVIRYAHLEDPADADSYPAGADVPFYVWLLNEGDQEVFLSSVTTPLAPSVSMTKGSLPVSLPPNRLVALGPREEHLVLDDIDHQIRGQEIVPVTVKFSDGSSAELEVEPIEVDPDALDLSDITG